MPIKESLYPEHWIAKAKQDLRRAEILFNAEDTEGAGFNLQQAIEKSLKAFLLANGWELKRIHDLIKLLNHAVSYDPELDKYRNMCEQVTEYYIEDRYPFFGTSSPDSEDIEDTLKKTNELIGLIEVKLGKK